MRKVLRVLGLLVLAVVVAGGAFAAYVAASGIPKHAPGHVHVTVHPTPDKGERGKKRASLLCASCHLDRTTGRLPGQQMADAPPAFGPIFSKNITQDPTKGIGGWGDGELAYLLRTGVDRNGQYLPPYMVKL